MSSADGSLRVLRVLTRANVGGPARQAFDLWAAHRALGVQTLLVVGAVSAGETELPATSHVLPGQIGTGDTVSIPVLTVDAALAAGPDASGVVALPAMRRGVNPRAGRPAD